VLAVFFLYTKIFFSIPFSPIVNSIASIKPVSIFFPSNLTMLLICNPRLLACVSALNLGHKARCVRCFCCVGFGTSTECKGAPTFQTLKRDLSTTDRNQTSSFLTFKNEATTYQFEGFLRVLEIQHE